MLAPDFTPQNFETAVNLDLSAQETELKAIRTDYNRHHFVRDEAFKLNTEHPKFFPRLQCCADYNLNYDHSSSIINRKYLALSDRINTQYH